jgi:acetyl esterase/lipase
MTILDAKQPTRRSLSPMRLGMAAGMLVIAVIAVVSCGGRGGSTGSTISAGSDAVTTSTAPSTTSLVANSGVSVVRGELYREPTSADGAGCTVDIYVGDRNEGAPLVVLLHGYSSTGPGRPDDDLGPLSEQIAGLGSTVFYFGWQTTRGYSADSFADLSCVGPFVAARAAEFGADPDNVIVVGHSQGATSGGMLAFSSFDLTPSPGCTETGQASSPVALLGIGGGYGVAGGPLDDDHTRFRVRTSPAAPFQELDADEEILSGLTAAQIYQLDGYSALPPVGELSIVLLVGSEDQYSATNSDVTAQFAEALQAVNVDVEVKIVDGANHDDIVDPATQAGQATLQVLAEILTNTR